MAHLQQLSSLGTYLDSAEEGLLPMDPKAYQAAAQTAISLLSQHRQDPGLRDLARRSPALAALRSNMGMELALMHGLLPRLQFSMTASPRFLESRSAQL